MLLSLVTGTTLVWKERGRARLVWASSSASALTGLLVVASWPGNYLRMEGIGGAIERTAHLPSLLMLGARVGFLNTASWILDPILLLVSLAAVIHPDYPSMRSAIINRKDPVFIRRTVVTTTVLAVSLGFLIPTVLTRKAPSYRTQDGIHLIFLVGWFSLLVLFDLAPSARASSRLLVSATTTLAMASMLLTPNTLSGVKDVLVRGPVYDAAMRQRYEDFAVASKAGAPHVSINAPPVYPSHQHFRGDVVEDAQDWRNLCTAHFFGLESVTLVTD